MYLGLSLIEKEQLYGSRKAFFRDVLEFFKEHLELPGSPALSSGRPYL